MVVSEKNIIKTAKPGKALPLSQVPFRIWREALSCIIELKTSVLVIKNPSMVTPVGKF